MFGFLTDPDAGLSFNAVKTITVLLLGMAGRKGTEDQIVDGARQLPCIQRMLNSRSSEKLRFDVNFPPENYRQLRLEPKLSERLKDETALARWHADVGLVMAEEEQDLAGSRRYQQDFGRPVADWEDDFNEEFDRLRMEGRRLAPQIVILPPGQENFIFANIFEGNSGGYDFAQTAWHFDRIINAMLSMPHLEKVVINVCMSCLEAVDPGHDDFYIRPDLWPSPNKLAWGRLKPRVFIPEHRAAERWLQALIDSPNNDLAKVGLVLDEDWCTNESPVGMITDALQEAGRRYADAMEHLS
ncbi:hypothetical protein CC86DRAFT_413689 [Ophiobolus disseminans]|uniref:Uncharacterized protein n=1 Tax=Ophiobolus disseminans TaxID=1469910 RepID=A0A6A6ZCF4_9PLEO|nr:hypothetical protein CC86DRAFT_413689 [Ophiobolus disseminans]